MRALIIVDMQYDFLPGGTLAVPEGDKIIQTINKLQDEYDIIVATQDWHPNDHDSFVTAHLGSQPFSKILLNEKEQVLWPVHCVQGTRGAELIQTLNQEKIDKIFKKGMDKEVDSYSGFFDNDKLKSTGLGDYLTGRGVTEVAVCGLALDYCVYFTANDSIDLGFKTSIIENASKPIDLAEYQLKKIDFLAKGGFII